MGFGVGFFFVVLRPNWEFFTHGDVDRCFSVSYFFFLTTYMKYNISKIRKNTKIQDSKISWCWIQWTIFPLNPPKPPIFYTSFVYRLDCTIKASYLSLNAKLKNYGIGKIYLILSWLLDKGQYSFFNILKTAMKSFHSTFTKACFYTWTK